MVKFSVYLNRCVFIMEYTYKGDNFCDFLFAFLSIRAFLKRVCSNGKEMISLREIHVDKGDKPILIELPAMNVYRFPLTFQSYRPRQILLKTLKIQMRWIMMNRPTRICTVCYHVLDLQFSPLLQ